MSPSSPPRSRLVRALVLTALGLSALGLAAVLSLRVIAASAPSDKAPWWGWWSWADGWFGLTWHGVAVGSAERAITGSDQLVSQGRALAPFHAVRLRGPIDLVLRQSGRVFASVHTDDNIAALIRTDVVDGELRIEPVSDAAFRSRHAIGVTLDLQDLDRLNLSGNGDVICAQLDVDELDLDVQGEGRVRVDDLHARRLHIAVHGARDLSLAGSASQQHYEVDGAARIDAHELVGDSARVVLNGAADVSLWVNRLLDVNIQGAGRVRYRGVAQLQSDIHGIGVVEHQ